MPRYMYANFSNQYKEKKVPNKRDKRNEKGKLILNIYRITEISSYDLKITHKVENEVKTQRKNVNVENVLRFRSK